MRQRLDNALDALSKTPYEERLLQLTMCQKQAYFFCSIQHTAVNLVPIQKIILILQRK